MTEPETEPEPEAPAQLPVEPETEPPPEGPGAPQVPTEPVSEPPPAPPTEVDVRTAELLERRRKRLEEADEARAAMDLHASRAATLREQVGGDMGPEIRARYEDLALVSDAMARVARRVWKYKQARVVEADQWLAQEGHGV